MPKYMFRILFAICGLFSVVAGLLLTLPPGTYRPTLLFSRPLFTIEHDPISALVVALEGFAFLAILVGAYIDKQYRKRL